jgi:hypothetical protein
MGWLAYSCKGLMVKYSPMEIEGTSGIHIWQREDLRTFEKGFGAWVAPNPFSNHSQMTFGYTIWEPFEHNLRMI